MDIGLFQFEAIVSNGARSILTQCVCLYLFVWDIHLEVEFLGYRVCMFSILVTPLFSRVILPFYSPTSSG